MLGSLIVGALHHHADEARHEDCQLCITAQVSATTVQETIPTLFPFITEILNHTEPIARVLEFVQSAIARAPPVAPTLS